MKVEATEHHPAQAKIVHDDVLVDYWSQLFTSERFPIRADDSC